MTTPTDDEVRALVERLHDCDYDRDAEPSTIAVCIEAATMLSRLLAERAEARKAERPKERWAIARELYEARYPIRGAGTAHGHWDALPRAERAPWLACADVAVRRIRSALATHPTDPQKVRDEALEDALATVTRERDELSVSFVSSCEIRERLVSRAAAAEASLSTLRAENERLRGALHNGRALLLAWQAQHPDDAVLTACVDNMRAALGGE